MGIRIPKMFLFFEKIFYCKKSNAVFIYWKSALVGAVIIITLRTEVLKGRNDPLPIIYTKVVGSQNGNLPN